MIETAKTVDRAAETVQWRRSLSPTTLTIVSAGAIAKNQVLLAETELRKAPTLDALFITYKKRDRRAYRAVFHGKRVSRGRWSYQPG